MSTAPSVVGIRSNTIISSYIKRANSVCEMSAMVTNCDISPYIVLWTFCEKREIILTSPLPYRVTRRLLDTRPPLNEKLFPVHCPSGLKRADWKCYFHNCLFFLPCPPVHSSLYKHEIRKKRIPDRPTGRFFTHSVDRNRLFI